MRVAVVGAGPVGAVCAVGLTRRGHDVLLVDRDPGPPPDEEWNRQGVMQFHHPHYFRADVRRGLLEHVPDAWEAVVEAGGLPALPEGMPEVLTALACRRSTFERAIHDVLAREPGLARYVGTADRVVVERGRVVGLVLDGTNERFDLVLDASGRSTHLGDELRPPAEGGRCGFSYSSRMYAALPGTEPWEGPLPDGAEHDGYLCIAFPQDAGTLSVLIVRASDDEGLKGLKRPEAFEAALAAIPHFAKYVDPARFAPISPARPGGGLTNTFRRQPVVPGLIAVGDAVSTTNPMGGRGVALGIRQAGVLLGLLDHDPDGAAAAFEEWCEDGIRPWFEDHTHWDATMLQRWAGAELDVEGRLPSDVICAAAAVDPSMMRVVGPFFGMLVDPRELQGVAEQARAVLRTGWRPPVAAGPSHDELVELVAAASSARG